MELFNLNNVTVDASGKVTFSGLSSGIDFNKVTDDIIAAKRIPIDSIEAQITENTDKITALEDLRGLLTALRDSLDDLRGKVSVGNAGNIFAAKQVFASTSRTDGLVPSAAANLLGASATNAAANDSHTIEVLRVAAAHKVASTTFTSKTTALALSGNFEVTGSKASATIAVTATDTLQDIRDRINNANTGTTATGMTASIVQAATSQFILVLTSDDTGQSMRITDTGTVLSGLGISSTNGAGGFRNGVGAASKIDATNDGFKHILFDGTQGDKAFLISYDQATKVMTLTRGDGQTDTATLSSTAIATGKTETATFSKFGATIVLDENFSKTTDILVDADTASVTGGTGAIDANTIKITGSTGNVSGIASTTLTFGNLATPNAISVSVGGFSGTFDGTSTGTKTVTLSDGSGNVLTIQFNVGGVFDGTETAASIDLQELENLVVSNGTQFTNELQASQTARFTADGLLDQDRFESRFVTNSSSTLSSLAPQAGSPGSFDIKVGSGTVTVNYTGTDTLAQLVTAINSAITTAGAGNAVFDAGTSASLMTDGGGVRLVITNTSGAAISLTDTNNLLAGLGVDNNLVIERTSNTVSDLFDGITLTLFQAEEGTQVKLDVERDLAAAKTAIQNLVTTYNELKKSLNQHSKVDSSTGTITEDTGVLFGTPTLLGITSRVSSVFSQETQGVDTAFAALSQIGVKFVDNNSISDPLLANTLEIDETALDAALLNNPDDVRRLFTFDFSSSDPRVSLLSFTGKTAFNASGYTLNIDFDDRFHSQAFTAGGSFTLVDAQDGGPASDGISAITFGDAVVSGNAYRYSYTSATEQLSLTNVTTGLTETVDITSTLDAIGNGGDLDAGETATITFSAHNATITLSGDKGFTRATNISNGALDTTDLAANGLTMTGGAVTTPVSGLNKATVDALRAAGAFSTTTGLLTLNVDSTGVGNATFDAAAGIKFAVDGGVIGAGPTVNVGDGAAHTIDIYVNDGTSDIKVATHTFTSLTSAGAGTGNLTIDLGTGLVGETSTVASDKAPMENFLTLSNGSFEIRDASSTLLGTVSYNKTDSLTDLANNITANVTDVSASVINASGTFKLEIVHKDRDVLTFTNDSDGLLSQLSLANGGDAVFTANIDGAANGGDNLSTTVSARSMTATSLTGAEGLKVFYSGIGDLSGVKLNFTVGFGARLFFEIDELLTAETGLIDSNVETLKEQNKLSQSRVDDMLARLEQTRELLVQRFINAETALAQAKNLQENLRLAFDALFANQNKR
ncbi:MAG: flagellar filament capping protein FliD [Kiloniellaceae bacterium]